MQTYAGSCTSYSIKELNETAKEKAYEKWRDKEDPWLFWWDEAKASLDKFLEIFDVSLRYWEFDGYNMAHWNLKIENDTLNNDEESLSGIRLATYLWNNYAQYIQKGKYYSLWSKVDFHDNPYRGKLKSRHSKIMVAMDGCPMTGVCYDCSLLNHMLACLHYKETYDSYADLIDVCLEEFFKDCMSEYEYRLSEEYFIEEAEANEYEYYEDGRAFYLPSNFVNQTAIC